MKVQVKLTDIIEGMESQSFDNRVFLELDTGEVLHILNEFIRKAEDEEPYNRMNDWEQEMMQLADQIIENENKYIELPEYEIDEYNMMENFCYTITDATKEKTLLDFIRGR